MEHHFRAFSFVDRVVSVRPGVRIHGQYTIPERVESFPLSLVSEAVGQLAAWDAMAAFNFERRPVAGIAGEIQLLAPVRPGQVLDLESELETVDADAVAYGGVARVGSAEVIRLHHCVGPMVAVTEFDDPEALRKRFELLCGAGATPGAFAGVPPLVLGETTRVNGSAVRATFQVPARAAIFEDHFPRRPVFPGTLLMHMNLQLADMLAPDFPPPAGGGRWVLRSLHDVKLRAWIPPGEQLQLEARLCGLSDREAIASVETRNGTRLVGGARVSFVPEPAA